MKETKIRTERIKSLPDSVIDKTTINKFDPNFAIEENKNIYTINIPLKKNSRYW